MKKKKKVFVIRDLTTISYFWRTEPFFTYFTKDKNVSPRFEDDKIFETLEVLRERGHKVIHEAV